MHAHILSNFGDHWTVQLVPLDPPQSEIMQMSRLGAANILELQAFPMYSAEISCSVATNSA